MRKFLPGLLCVFAAVAAEAATISITPSNVGEHRTLQDGNTYVFAEDVEFAAEICTSALSVADGATVETFALDPKPDDVICDPACGTSGFLVAASEYLKETKKKYPNKYNGLKGGTNPNRRINIARIILILL